MNEIKEKNKRINIYLYSFEYARFVSEEVENLRKEGKMKLLEFHHKIYQDLLKNEDEKDFNKFDKEFPITDEELRELKEFFEIKKIEIKENLIKGEM